MKSYVGCDVRICYVPSKMFIVECRSSPDHYSCRPEQSLKTRNIRTSAYCHREVGALQNLTPTLEADLRGRLDSEFDAGHDGGGLLGLESWSECVRSMWVYDVDVR